MIMAINNAIRERTATSTTGTSALVKYVTYGPTVNCSTKTAVYRNYVT
jgi:hypothetical protein